MILRNDPSAFFSEYHHRHITTLIFMSHYPPQFEKSLRDSFVDRHIAVPDNIGILLFRKIMIYVRWTVNSLFHTIFKFSP